MSVQTMVSHGWLFTLSMPPEVEITYIEGSRGMLWTEYIDEIDLNAKLREARSNNELEKAEAISEACVRANRHAQIAFMARLDDATDSASA